MTEQRISQIRKMMNAASKGPWEISLDGGKTVRAVSDDELIADTYSDAHGSADAALIAEAPTLAREVIELCGELERMKKEKELCLKICEERNGLPYCKNCGLGPNSPTIKRDEV